MKIRVILPAIIGTLACFLFVVTAVAAYRTVQLRSALAQFVETDAVSISLLQANADWAVERGTTNRALAADTPVQTEEQAKIQAKRDSADSAFASALAGVRVLDEKRADGAVLDAQKAYERLKEKRHAADTALTMPKTERAPEVQETWVPTITGLINAVSTLNHTLETLLSAPTTDIARLVSVRRMAAEMAEYAGRERARLSAVIQAGRPLTSDDGAALSLGRGYIDMAFKEISLLRVRDDTPKTVRDAVDLVEKAYMRDYTALRGRVLASGLAGEAYPLDAKAYFTQVSTAIDAILDLSKQIGAANAAAVAQERRSTGLALFLDAVLLLVSFGLGVASFAFTMRRIVRPLARMTSDMERLIGGDTALEISGLERADEVGDMARAVEVFKDNALAIESMATEREEIKRRADAEKHKGMLALANRFEENVRDVVHVVSTASSEMQSTAQVLSATATEASDRVHSVRSASDEMGIRFQVVSSVSEEVATSIVEIQNLVDRASQAAGAAAREGEEVDRTVQRLSEAAQRIGQVVGMINSIAAQTKLLALNATIEAGRAGEMGKGFAVVATEVKSLAAETATATEEVTTQVNAIQTETAAAMEGIKGVLSTIVEIKDISDLINCAVQMQAESTQGIVENIHQASVGKDQVAQGIGSVNQAAEETGAAAMEVLGAATELSKQSDVLRREIEGFIEIIRAG